MAHKTLKAERDSSVLLLGVSAPVPVGMFGCKHRSRDAVRRGWGFPIGQLQHLMLGCRSGREAHGSSQDDDATAAYITLVKQKPEKLRHTH